MEFNGGKDCCTAATWWWIENPAQQEQWQKGEQSSSCLSPSSHLDSSYFTLPSFCTNVLTSPQGKQLSDNTSTAIMKANRRMGAKIEKKIEFRSQNTEFRS
jgi:hypothetical protein